MTYILYSAVSGEPWRLLQTDDGPIFLWAQIEVGTKSGGILSESYSAISLSTKKSSIGKSFLSRANQNQQSTKYHLKQTKKIITNHKVVFKIEIFHTVCEFYQMEKKNTVRLFFF